MSKNALVDIFTMTFTKENKEKIIVVILTIVLFSICIITASLVNPKGCDLFSSNIPGPQSCHTIPMPEGCFSCKNIAGSYAASAIAGLGIITLFIPVVIFFLRRLSNRSNEQTKLFD